VTRFTNSTRTLSEGMSNVPTRCVWTPSRMTLAISVTLTCPFSTSKLTLNVNFVLACILRLLICLSSLVRDGTLYRHGSLKMSGALYRGGSHFKCGTLWSYGSLLFDGTLFHLWLALISWYSLSPLARSTSGGTHRSYGSHLLIWCSLWSWLALEVWHTLAGWLAHEVWYSRFG
jgi:hypothetical protein